MTRRELLQAGAAAAITLAAPARSLAAKEAPSRSETEHKEKPMEATLVAPKLVDVPQAIPEKVYTSEKVGISRKTHDEHLKLWQGYANKTNEIRKALSEMEV